MELGSHEGGVHVLLVVACFTFLGRKRLTSLPQQEKDFFHHPATAQTMRSHNLPGEEGVAKFQTPFPVVD